MKDPRRLINHVAYTHEIWFGRTVEALNRQRWRSGHSEAFRIAELVDRA
jgi:hypothetical protein